MTLQEFKDSISNVYKNLLGGYSNKTGDNFIQLASAVEDNYSLNSAVVHKTGDETITGNKTINSTTFTAYTSGLMSIGSTGDDLVLSSGGGKEIKFNAISRAVGPFYSDSVIYTDNLQSKSPSTGAYSYSLQNGQGLSLTGTSAGSYNGNFTLLNHQLQLSGPANGGGAGYYTNVGLSWQSNLYGVLNLRRLGTDKTTNPTVDIQFPDKPGVVALDGEVIHKTGNEIISGIKSFSQFQSELGTFGSNGYQRVSMSGDFDVSSYNSSFAQQASVSIVPGQVTVKSNTADKSLNLTQDQIIFGNLSLSQYFGRISTDVTSNSDYAWKLPAKAGTFAMLSDITAGGFATDTSVVHKTGTETIAGDKTLTGFTTTGDIQVGSGSTDNLYFGGASITFTPSGSSFISAITSLTLTANRAIKLPNANGTIALTSDITKTAVGLSNVDNTSDATKNTATATLTNKTLTSPVINSPTGIVKGDVGLGNVLNLDQTNPANITQNSSYRFVTDTEKTTWNAKQNALTFDSTPTASSTNPVTSGGVKDAFAVTQASISGTIGGPSGSYGVLSWAATFNTTSTISINNTTIYYGMFIVNSPTGSITISNLGFEVTVAVASSTAKVGIYSSDPSNFYKPLTKLGETADISTGSTSTGIVGALGSPLTLSNGIYWTAITGSSTGVNLRSYAGNNPFISRTTLTTTANGPGVGGYTSTTTSGVLTTTPTISGTSSSIMTVFYQNN